MTSIPTMPNVKPTQQTLDANTEETRFREELDAAERLMIVNENIGLRRNIEAHAAISGHQDLYRPAPGGELANLHGAIHCHSRNRFADVTSRGAQGVRRRTP